MSFKDVEEFKKRLCPHRGAGIENTLSTVQSGIGLKPFFVEFDVQWHGDGLYLGHPPDMSKNTSLSDVLNLFANTPVLPKIDTKLDSHSWQLALSELIRELRKLGSRKALVNISGDLIADKYFEAETLLVKATSHNTLLNIDLKRYQGKSQKEVIEHIEWLGRKPFSISPNIDSDVEHAINFAIQEQINQVHFWAFPESKHSLQKLYELMELYLGRGLEVYFDIRADNIVSNIKSAT